MTTIAEQNKLDFVAALQASGRSRDIPETDDAYGWLVGDWEFDVFDHMPDGTIRKSYGEAHFAWALEGRVVQDVWIIPRISDRSPQLGTAGNRYGTTLRVWDATIRAWRITWINPVSGARDEMIGRRIGTDVVQVGTHSDGTPIRWCYRDVTPDSFRWTGEVLESDGETWRMQVEFLARRVTQK